MGYCIQLCNQPNTIQHLWDPHALEFSGTGSVGAPNVGPQCIDDLKMAGDCIPSTYVHVYNINCKCEYICISTPGGTGRNTTSTPGCSWMQLR